MSIFLSHEIVVFLLIEVILLALMSIAQANIVVILRYWDFEASSALQYRLEKKNYLINTILYFTVATKIDFFFLFFVQLVGRSTLRRRPRCDVLGGRRGRERIRQSFIVGKVMADFRFRALVDRQQTGFSCGGFSVFEAQILALYVFVCRRRARVFSWKSPILETSLNVPVFCCSVVFQAPKLPFGVHAKSFWSACFTAFLLRSRF